MARVSNVEIDAVPDDVKPVYERYASEYGPFLNQVRVFAHRPPAVRQSGGQPFECGDVSGTKGKAGAATPALPESPERRIQT